MTSLWNDWPGTILLILAAVGSFGPSWNLASASPQESSTPTTIADGTTVHLCLLQDLDSKKAKNGDVVNFKVRESVQVNGVEVIPAGSAVLGHIVSVGHNGFAGHSGKLGLSVDYAVAVDGTKIPLRGDAAVKGGSQGAVTAAATATWGPPALLMRGWNAEIHKGTLLNAYVHGNQTVFRQVSATNTNPVPAPSTSATAAEQKHVQSPTEKCPDDRSWYVSPTTGETVCVWNH